MTRQNLLLGLALATCASLISCKKDAGDQEPNYECSSCVKTPEALAANDMSARGIYKGVLVASTGTVRLHVANNGTAINGTMIVNGATINLSSTFALVPGQAFVGTFTGTHNGQPAGFTFSVNADGTTPSISSVFIPGHTIPVITIAKETSGNLIECFEGTYSLNTGKRGTYNILLGRNARVWGGVSREQNTTGSNSLRGTIDATGRMIDNTNLQVGQLTGDNISGTFPRGNETLTVVGRRTL